MAKNKRSLFEWITGSSEDAEYTFDELEQGGASYGPVATPTRTSRLKVRNEEPAPEPVEEESAGELAVDVYQTPTHIIIKAMIAGVRPEDLDVSITRDMVTVRGKRERTTEGTAGDFFFQELYWGSFTRTVVLPQEIDIEGAEASEKHGLLIIKLPKLDKGRQAKLKVKAN
ncbi:MAG: Hsp20/alpha crystallin family protein [Patescibacteria group bacterium]